MAVTGDPATAVRRGQAEGVGLSRPVPRRRWLGQGDFPVSDRLHRSLVSVPIYPGLTGAEIGRVRQTLRKVVGIG
jgi:dTDP-4-amino-4,6-dideoxygalactose transaminase